MHIDRPQCDGCGAPSPPTDTNYTLISQKHGWRLVLQQDKSGQRVGKWWCPNCWAKEREQRKQTAR
ncbi:MAG TPA: hypothetical protein VGM06_00460 [Polyangiaceae bacterium]